MLQLLSVGLDLSPSSFMRAINGMRDDDSAELWIFHVHV